MNKWGHIGVNIGVYAPAVHVVAATWSLEVALVGGIVAISCALLPDIDEFVPRLSHRGPTHTIWTAVAIGTILALGTTIAFDVHLAVFVGFLGAAGLLAHIAVDALTPMGIAPFAPLSQYHISLQLFESENRTINGGSLAAGVLAMTVAFAVTI